MEANLKVKAAKIGALVLKKPFITDANVAYRSVKVGEQLGFTTGEVKLDDPWDFVRIVVPVPDGNPLDPATTYTDWLFWVPDDGSWEFDGLNQTVVVDKPASGTGTSSTGGTKPSGSIDTNGADKATRTKDAQGRDVITAPGGATVEIWKLAPETAAKPVIPKWAVWGLIGLAVVTMIALLYGAFRKPQTAKK